MRKVKYVMLTAVLSLVCGVITSCGGGVDRSNPQSVAEKALECFYSADFDGLKELVNPENGDVIKQIEDMGEMSAKYLAEHPEKKPTPVAFTFKRIGDGLRGGDFTPATTTARVYFESEQWPGSVVVEKVDGKWYFEQFK